MAECRDPIFDILKGIGIVLVILGHCDLQNLDQVIFSFHMPLFFFISGYFSKKKDSYTELYFNFRKLIIPYLTAFIILFILSFIYDFLLGSLYLKKATASFLLCRNNWTYSLFWDDFPYIGPLWFFLSLFEVRVLHLLFQKISKNTILMLVIATILALLGQGLATKVGQVPFFIFPSLGCYGFFYVGSLLKQYNCFKSNSLNRFFPGLLTCWFFCIFHSKLGLHINLYQSFYIIDLLGALGAFLMLYAIVQRYYINTSFIWRILHFIGKNSIFIFFIHAIDHCFFYRWSLSWATLATYLPPFLGGTIIPIFRLLLAILFGYILTKSKFIRKKIFFICNN